MTQKKIKNTLKKFHDIKNLFYGLKHKCHIKFQYFLKILKESLIEYSFKWTKCAILLLLSLFFTKIRLFEIIEYFWAGMDH